MCGANEFAETTSDVKYFVKHRGSRAFCSYLEPRVLNLVFRKK